MCSVIKFTYPQKDINGLKCRQGVLRLYALSDLWPGSPSQYLELQLPADVCGHWNALPPWCLVVDAGRRCAQHRHSMAAACHKSWPVVSLCHFEYLAFNGTFA